MQDRKPIAFYSRKLNTAQKRYTTTERNRELLSAIETCKEYKNILLGYHVSIVVFTDHKNNTFNGLNVSDRVLRTCWLLLLEEYGVTFEYLRGKKNVVADVLSLLDIDSLKIQEEETLTLLSGSENNSINNIEFPMHTALIFKSQAKIKEQGLGEKGYSNLITQYNIFNDMICFVTKKRSTFLNHLYKEYCPGTMKIYFIRYRQEQKRLSGRP
jgi:hypothetical protein